MTLFCYTCMVLRIFVIRAYIKASNTFAGIIGIPVDGIEIHNYILTDEDLFYMPSK